MFRRTGLLRPRRLVTAALGGGVILAAVGCYAPRGSLDEVSVSTTPAGVSVGGWVDDQDATSPSLVRIAVDGTTAVLAPANGDRPDVRAAVPGAKLRSGFTFVVPVSAGTHQVCAWAVNTGGNEADKALGCRTVTYPSTGTPPSSGRGSPASYGFLQTNADQSPVRWDGCRAVHYVTRTATAGYPGALADIQAGVAAVSAETGLQFVYDGDVATVPTRAYGGAVGGVDPPLLVGFTTSAESDLFSGFGSNTLAVAGSWTRTSGGRTSYVSGRVGLASDRLNQFGLKHGTGPQSVAEVVMHEVGHIVGLAHVDDDTQIMNPYMVNYGDWGAGDKAGLRAEGTNRATCGAGAAPSARAVLPDSTPGPLVGS